MKDATKRSVLRWIHLVFSIPIVGYIYSPFEQIPNYAPVVRYVAVPFIVLTGLWMWKGHVLRRLISKTPAQPAAAGNLIQDAVSKLK
jgi:thiosulfate reductase cytochrome b subunit